MNIFSNWDLPAKTNGKVQQGNSATFCDPKAATTIHQVHAMNKNELQIPETRQVVLLSVGIDFADD